MRDLNQMSKPNEFTPADKTRAAFKLLRAGLADAIEQTFFEVWEAEIADPDAPRKAGSVVAAAYMENAAKFAIFGAHCAGKKPSLELWLAMAEENFNKAIFAVEQSFAIADEQENQDV